LYWQLLNFSHARNAATEDANTWAEADVRLRVVYVVPSETSHLVNPETPNRVDLLFTLAPFFSEFDLSMLDRIHAYSYPQMTNLFRPVSAFLSGMQHNMVRTKPLYYLILKIIAVLNSGVGTKQPNTQISSH
jgi:hypothetical protein